jgi:antitoxin ChpS
MEYPKMSTVNLRKVGGSIMLTISPAFLEQLHLEAGAMVGITVLDGCLVINPKPKRRYTMAELLAASDYSQPQPQEERKWIDAPAVGRELI